MGANVSQNGWRRGGCYYCWGGLLSNKAQSYFPPQTAGHKLTQTHRVSEREVCEEACFITPHFSIRLRCHTHLSASSVSRSITVISSGNTAIFSFIKCQKEPQTLQASVFPNLQEHGTLLLPLRIAITEK